VTETVVFVIASAMALVGAVGVVVRRNPVHAALSLVLTLFGVAVHFVALQAHFLAAVQVIVYAGAIVVLFLFVIMLLGVDESEDIRIEPFKVQRPIAALVGVGLLGFVGTAVISNGQRKSVNSERATRSTLLPRPASPPRMASLGGASAPVAHWCPVRNRISATSTTPRTMARIRWYRSGSLSRSGWSTPRSMITNRNSTTIAPA
jgi:NADH:ubiquinone oxidoreductase subunit 6 (subunit J)